MSTVGIVLLVFFVIVSLLLVLLVAIQDDGESGMGGLLGGRGTAAFGSHSASVLTKATAVLVVLFFVLALGLALVNKPKHKAAAIDEVKTTATSEESITENSSSTWWTENSENANITSTEETVPAESAETE
jgi:preprotein translocase subunit SecG